MTAPAGDLVILHASSVALNGRAVLITGPSGSGKSSLALRMLSLGARLVSDDRTEVHATAAGLIARCPAAAISGLIEARGVGLLRAPVLDSAPVALVVDLSRAESERLPPFRTITILGQELPLVLRPQNDHLAEAICLYLQGGRQA